MKRIAFALIASAIVAATAIGAAASLGPITSSLGASDATVASCDTDGVSASYSLLYLSGGFVVDRVTVSGVTTPACDGKRIDVVLTKDGVQVGTGSGTLGAGAGGTTVSIAARPSAKDVNDIHIAIN
jgi:hypothetical protein